MSEIINEFKIFNYLPKNIIKNIVCFTVCDNSLGRTGFCVTRDDKVYGIGDEISKKCGYTESNNKYTLIPEFCDKHIEEFFGRNHVMFARSVYNEIYTWGLSGEPGQLGYLKPQKIDYFDGKNIIQVSCGEQHCLALSSDSVLYGWALDNSLKKSDVQDQVKKIKYNFKPTVIEQNETVKNVIEAVGCSGMHSYIITSGDVYELTDNGLQIYVKTIEKIKPIDENVFYVKDIQIDSRDSNILIETSETVYSYSGNDFITRTEYKNLFEYYLFERQATYKTMHLKDNGLYAIDFKLKTTELTETPVFMKTFKQIYSNIEEFYNKFTQNKEISTKLKSFSVFNDLPKSLESDVKYYYFWGEWDSTEYSALFVMSDNRVFGIGYNNFGKLGFGHNRRVNDYTLIPELCDQNIQEFFEGNDCMFARNDQGYIFGWGNNCLGQLGMGSKSSHDEYFKPEKISYFDDKNIIQINCGSEHCLALSSDGLVYGWCQNKHGQIGLDFSTVINPTPSPISCENKYKFIDCYHNSSTVVTIDGKVEFWGKVYCHDHIVALEHLKIKKVLLYLDSYFILTEDELLFYIKTDIEQIGRNVSDIYRVNCCNRDNCSVAFQLENRVYEFNEMSNELEITDYFNFYDYYLQKWKLLYKTIHITSDGYLMTNEIKFNENYEQNRNENIFITENKNVFGHKFENVFEDISEIHRGGFDRIFKARHKIDKALYSIKIIETDDFLSALLEVRMLAELNSDFVVQYINAWIESQIVFKRIKNFIFIQMEFCSQNLREVIESMDRISDNRFKTFKYWISCELFRELTECVHYLHSLTPPIIHRDLKPENVLISDGSDGRFLKLCDFGLAKIDQTSIHTRMRGTWSYMAPETKSSDRYNLKVDIYSLGVIATDIFGFEKSVEKIRQKSNLPGADLPKFFNTRLGAKVEKLFETLSYCRSYDYKERPSCKELLDRMNDWTIDKNTVLNEENIEEFRSLLTKQENTFLKKFFEFKLK